MVDETLLAVAESIGTAAFSISGAAKAVEKKMDLFGVIMMGIVTAFFGGVTRDILMGRIPPRMFYDAKNLTIAVVSAVAIFFFMDWRNKRELPLRFQNFDQYFDQIVNVFDAVGLGAFAILGVEAGIFGGYGDQVLFCICLGTLTGVGGGIVRDIFCMEIPGVFREHIYAVAAIIGSILYYYMMRFGVPLLFNIITTMLLVLVIRVVASLYRLNLPRAHHN